MTTTPKPAPALASERCDVAVLGGGPAGLMAAEAAARAGARVVVVEAKPTLARKFLMAGKSGLNLTRDQPIDEFLAAYGPHAAFLAPHLRAFGPPQVRRWAEGLGIALFAGSTGRVFPVGMKASPLLRAWIARLQGLGVRMWLRMRVVGLGRDGEVSLRDETGAPRRLVAGAAVLAMGGASWPRLGSDGAWVPMLAGLGVPIEPLAASNAGLRVAWSAHMHAHLGAPVKNVAFHAGRLTSRGECVISRKGLEGGAVYPLGPAVRAGHALTLDLQPMRAAAEVAARLARTRRGDSLSRRLAKALRLSPAAIALAREFAHPLPAEPQALAACLKALPVRHDGLAPLAEAISTAGGLAPAALDADLALRGTPWLFAAGEMIGWDAPTGGYLLTACLATGRSAGLAAAARTTRSAPAMQKGGPRLP